MKYNQLNIRFLASLTFTLFHIISIAQTSKLDSLSTSSLDTLIIVDIMPQLDAAHEKVDTLQIKNEQKVNGLMADLEPGHDPLTDSVHKSLPTDIVNQKTDSISSVLLQKKKSFMDKRSQGRAKVNGPIQGAKKLKSTEKSITNHINKVDGIDKNITQNLDVKPSINYAGDVANELEEGRVGLPQSLKNFEDPMGDLDKNVTDDLGEINGLKQSITKEDIEHKLESKLSETDELSSLSEQSNPLSEFQSKAEDLANPEKRKDAVKKIMIKNIKDQAENHFSGHMSRLGEASDKLRKYKEKYSQVRSVKELEKRGYVNPLKEEKVINRLIPYLGFEISNNELLIMDLSPGLGYRLYPHLTVMLNYMYRLSFDENEIRFNDWSGTYGPRFSSNYSVFKKIYLKMEIEAIRTDLKSSFKKNDPEPLRDWVYGVYAGAGKTYTIRKKLKGSVEFLYNFSFGINSPYQSRLNIRTAIYIKE